MLAERVSAPRRVRPKAPYGNLIASLREKLNDEPGNLDLRLSLATHLGRAGRYGEAVEEAEKLVSCAPSGFGARRLLVSMKLHRLILGDRRASLRLRSR